MALQAHSKEPLRGARRTEMKKWAVVFMIMSAFMVGMNLFVSLGIAGRWPVETQISVLEPSMFSKGVLIFLVAALDSVAMLTLVGGGFLLLKKLFFPGDWEEERTCPKCSHRFNETMIWYEGRFDIPKWSDAEGRTTCPKCRHAWFA
jgi:hypothetical protein